MGGGFIDLLLNDSDSESVSKELDSLGIIDVRFYGDDYSVDNLKNAIEIVNDSDDFVQSLIKDKGWN